MDVGEQKEIAYEVLRIGVAQALKDGKSPDEVIDQFVESVGSDGLKSSITDDKLRAFMISVLAQIRKDEAAALERRLGM